MSLHFQIMQTVYIFATFLALQLVAQGAPASPVGPPIPLPKGVTLTSLYQVAKITANKATVESTAGYVFIVGVLEKDPILLPPCFQEERSSSETDINVSSGSWFWKHQLRLESVKTYNKLLI